jgi:hypothetical protein
VKKLILNKIINKKSFKLGNVSGLYIPSVDTMMHARLEHYRLFVDGTPMINYVYSQDDYPSQVCKMIYNDDTLPLVAELNRIFGL